MNPVELIYFMENTLQLAEQNFERFLPIVRSCYQNGKLDKAQAKNLISAYQSITVSAQVAIALYDNTSASVFYVTDNIHQYFYLRNDIIKWGPMLLFKVLHHSHYSFAFNSLRQEAKFVSNQPKSLLGKNTLYCCGLKIRDGKRNVRRVFLKGKQLQIDQGKKTSLSVFFLEEITHLVKGTHYWFRLECGPNTLAYVQQKGKRLYKDILSEREREITKLIAQNKSSQEIAERIHISKSTVETHRKNILKRTGAKDSTALTHLCKMSNLLTDIY